MPRAHLAIVEIKFSTPVPHENETREIEDILRRAGHISDLTITKDKITFYLWGDNPNEFKILDEMKAGLKQNKFSNFTFSASMYAKTDRDYSSKEGG